MKRGGPMTVLCAALVGLAIVLTLTGCATTQNELAKRVDLGDGLILDVIPVSLAGQAISAADPAAGTAFNMIEQRLAQKRRLEKGPFNGLDFTSQRTVILKDGTQITEDRIAQIVETLTPIVPDPITRVVTVDAFPTKPADADQNPVADTDGGGPVPSVSDILEAATK